jgi:glycosyltransferase involved in cell wall biosynthesis
VSVSVSVSLELTILMPCLNEARTVGLCVAKARGFLARAGIDGEVLVADNGSTDGSQRLAQEAGARVVDVAARGYGAALMGGIAAAQGRFIIMGDADDSYDFERLDPFVAELRRGAQLVMGNRFKGGIAPGAMPALHRYLGNPVLSGLGRLFFPSPVADFHCGLRGFDRDAMRALELSAPGMEFASEMVVKATAHGLRVIEVPTTLKPDGRGRPPHLRSWRDGWRHLRLLLVFSPRWLFLYPGLLLLAVGLLGMAWLLGGPRLVGGVAFSIHTLLFAGVSVVLGVQMCAFALVARLHAAHSGWLPMDERLQTWVQRATLERGLAAGLVLTATGLAGAAWALWQWAQGGLGQLVPEQTMRAVIPSAIAIVVGVQLTFASFLLETLQWGRRR